MRRREFTIGLTLATAVRMVRAQEPAKQHRIAIIITAGGVALISDTGNRYWKSFFEELRRLGHVEGQNVTVERYSAEGRPSGYADLAREVVNRNPDLIIAATAITQAVGAATATIPIVWIGADPIRAGLVTSLARPGSNLTGVAIDAPSPLSHAVDVAKTATLDAAGTASLRDLRPRAMRVGGRRPVPWRLADWFNASLLKWRRIGRTPSSWAPHPNFCRTAVDRRPCREKPAARDVMTSANLVGWQANDWRSR